MQNQFLKTGFFILLITFLFQCKSAFVEKEVLRSEDLIIRQITENTYVHISYLLTDSYGKVACNGVIITKDKEAIVYDTPADNATSDLLIDWVQNTLKNKITAIVPTHFHVDCLGGLAAFHDKGIPSYANELTIKLAGENEKTIPQNRIVTIHEHNLGNSKVISEFFGEGHTIDNIIAYFPEDKLLFGGCLIKEMGAGKGNLADANVDQWSATVEKIKKKYQPTIVIPGHGEIGGIALLDYTIEKFKK